MVVRGQAIRAPADWKSVSVLQNAPCTAFRSLPSLFIREELAHSERSIGDVAGIQYFLPGC